MQWPVSEVRIWAEFFLHEPSPEGRIEHQVAYLHSMYVNSHLKKGTPPKPLSDFLLFAKAWERDPQAPQQQPADASIASVFSAFGKVNRKR